MSEKHSCSQERFMQDVGKHCMTILRKVSMKHCDL